MLYMGQCKASANAEDGRIFNVSFMYFVRLLRTKCHCLGEHVIVSPRCLVFRPQFWKCEEKNVQKNINCVIDTQHNHQSMKF